jgi:signal transduction histidine kinase
LLKNAVLTIHEKEQNLAKSFNTTKDILTSMRKSKHFNKYSNEEEIYQDDVIDMFTTIALNDKNIMQFRYIDVNGFEKVRIDRKNIGDKITVIPNSALQNKLNRYYFKDSKSKVLEKVWFSNIDLNMENGKVEMPIKPTLRAILPIKNENKFDGIIIINYFMKNALINLATNHFYNFILINKNGNVLVHHNKDLSWSLYKNKNYKIKEIFPKYYKNILENKLYENSKVISKKLDIPTKEKMILVLQLKKSYLEEQRLEKLNQYIIISLIIIVLAAIMSFIFSNFVQKLMERLSSVKSSNRALKSTVREKNRELLKYNEELKSLNENLEKKVKEEVEKNKEKETQLFAQSKMVAMGEMIANIAHQWRQPLSIISTIASGIKLKHAYNHLNLDELPKQMNEIVDKTQHLSQTIDTFKNFLNEKKVVETIVLQDIIESSLNIIGSSLKNNNIELQQNKIEQAPIMINTVSNELIQVFINLINNAKDAILENEIGTPWIKIEVIKLDEEVHIIISDNAKGIPEDIISRIFEPYFTTKHKSQGTGLGLHMSYKIIVENLKGQLYAKNSEYGAKLYIKLPLQ